MIRLFLSRRNLLTLLNKLDRKARGGETACTLIKRDTAHPKFPSDEIVMVIGVEDAEYYTERPAGPVSPEDEPKKTV